MTNDEIAARAAQPTAEALGKWKGVPDRAVVRLLAAIRESFLDPDLRVEELRRSLGASNKLYTRFRKWIGISPRELVRECRMEAALRLLRDTPWSVADVAAEVGYFALPVFQRLCKSWCGLGPSRLRSSAREVSRKAVSRPAPDSDPLRLPDDALTWHFWSRCRRSELTEAEVRQVVAYLGQVYASYGPRVRETPLAAWERAARWGNTAPAPEEEWRRSEPCRP